jgi:hypothetical protein
VVTPIFNNHSETATAVSPRQPPWPASHTRTRFNSGDVVVELVLDRDREYRLDRESTRTLATTGAFRVIADRECPVE